MSFGREPQFDLVRVLSSGFMKFVVMPLFTEWRRFTATPLSNQMLQNVHHNELRWQAIEAGLEDGGDDDIISSLRSPVLPSVPRDNSAPPSSTTPPPSPPPPQPELQPQLLPRRHSMPKVLPPAAPLTATTTCHRRHSLPIVTISRSLEKLSEKLTMIAEYMPALVASSSDSGKSSVLGTLRPKIIQLGQNMDECAIQQGSAAGSQLTSAHGLDKLLQPAALPAVHCRRASMPYESAGMEDGGGARQLLPQQRGKATWVYYGNV